MDLYQELILDHSKRPHHAGLREPYDAQTHHINPTCGDEVTLRVHVTPTGQGDPPDRSATVTDVGYDAIGCSISVAAASILAEEVIGHTVGEALATQEAMRAMLTSRGTDPGDEEVIGDGVALAGVSKYPARVKCALLPWSAFTDALVRAGVDIASPETAPPQTATPQEATS
ncbi:nitrogen fixation NifU-like protein [Kineosphaera limosa]|uniref:Iron-sulfur cluster assembly protein IscU n=1 Tax=Kineosphaera limosa NBRC 100340 TaxID=1184609 RepID=K6VE45_9MICO|nr:SUF system NifU family Fe-S cluster assembly protein [Kineosphaera limosa]NYE03146.1 nitrogen fixation NifU-like protein [Kineosphaera limosa]GAB94483.1 iron-sulfur cluster assembly protein IscU [Kineosphaera limosa NBRC 100340]